MCFLLIRKAKNFKEDIFPCVLCMASCFVKINVYGADSLFPPSIRSQYLPSRAIPTACQELSQSR